jgi:fructuronate reductase
MCLLFRFLAIFLSSAEIVTARPEHNPAKSSCMVVDRNQRCYTNCVRWLRHKGILLESSPREWLMSHITTRVIMENTLLTANAMLPATIAAR